MRMKSIIVTLSLILYCVSTNAQFLEKVKNGYQLNSMEYNTDKDILELIKESPNATTAYKQSKFERNSANVFGVMSLVGLVASPIIFSQVSNPNGDSPNVDALFMGALSGLIGSISGLVAIRFLVSSKNKMNKKVVQYYNEDISLEYKSNSSQMGFSWKVNEQGVGFLFSF